MNDLHISDAGLSLLKRFEGFRAHVYDDTAGHPTIGYGHLLKPGESFPDGITEAQASDLLRADVAYAEHAVTSLVTVALNQGQFDALVDFAYNLGTGALRNSTLLRLLNAGGYAGAADQFRAWDHVGGVANAGLLRRRTAEREMFLGHNPFASTL